jgi:type IV secretion system protein VirD4
LLSWTGSAVIHDIESENWALTAGWCARLSHCLLFDPTNALSARYNPLLEVRRGAHEIRDVQNIADILVDPEGALERRNHWERSAPRASGPSSAPLIARLTGAPGGRRIDRSILA